MRECVDCGSYYLPNTCPWEIVHGKVVLKCPDCEKLQFGAKIL